MPENLEHVSGLPDTDQTEQERLFRLVASLANLLDRDPIVETLASVLGIDPVFDGDCVIFDDLAIRFGRDGKVACVFRTIDGSALSPD